MTGPIRLRRRCCSMSCSARTCRATFFLIDDHLTEETAPIVRRMFAEGHAVGLHSNERWLMLRSADRSPKHSNWRRTASSSSPDRARAGGSARTRAGAASPLYEALDSIGLSARGLELWSLGLELVASTRSRCPGRSSRAACPRRRHHRHSRRPSHRSARRPAICDRGDSAADSSPAGAADWRCERFPALRDVD